MSSDSGGDGAHAEIGNQRRNRAISETTAAIQSGTLDPTTQQEFQQMVDSGNYTGWSAGNVSAAMAGEGVYGIRRKNWELAKLLLDKPGRNQTILSVNSNSPMQPGSNNGAGGGSLLTGGSGR